MCCFVSQLQVVQKLAIIADLQTARAVPDETEARLPASALWKDAGEMEDQWDTNGHTHTHSIWLVIWNINFIFPSILGC